MNSALSKIVYDPRKGLYNEIRTQLRMYDNMQTPLRASDMLSTITTEKLICLLRLSKKQLETELSNTAQSDN